MADFLSRLAERTLGTAQVARPLATPLFGPAPAAPDVLEEVASNDPEGVIRPGSSTPPPHASFTPFADPPASPPSAQADPTAPTQGASAQQPVEEAGLVTGWDQVEPIRVLPPTRPQTTDPSAPIAPSPSDRLTPLVPIAFGARDAAASSLRPPSEADEAEAPARVNVLALVRPARPDGQFTADRVESERQVRPADTAPEPTINVTIGRIEVRAVFPTPLPARPAPAAGPQLTIEEYAKQRREGRR